MVRRPMPLRWTAPVLAACLVSFAASTASAAPPSEPTGTLRSTVEHHQWKIQLHTSDDATEIAVRHAQGGLETVLRPDSVLECPTGGVTGCRSVVDMPRQDSLRGKGMVVHASTPDAFHPPEITAVMYTGGPHCCFTAVGFWRGNGGEGWESARFNSGSTAITTDGKGRIRVGDRRWETLDWSYAASYPYRSWRTLDPARKAHWRVTSTKADHRRELRAATRTLRKHKRSKGRQSRESGRAVRAVIIAHRKALGQNAQVRSGRKSYRRMYGAKSLKRLDRGLRTVKRVS